MRFSLSRLQATLEQMPMLRILLPLILGILLAHWGNLPLWLCITGTVGAGVCSLMRRSSLGSFLFVLGIGFLCWEVHVPRATTPYNRLISMVLSIENPPSTHSSIMRADAQIEAWRETSSEHWQTSSSKVKIFADSTLRLLPSERLYVSGIVRPFKSGKPSFLKLMRHRGFIGNLWLKDAIVWQKEPLETETLHTKAAQRMVNLCASIQKDSPRSTTRNAEAILRAMVIADKSSTSTELRTAFSKSGMAHLLAVSGLHTGIVFLLLNLTLGGLVFLRHGHLLRNIAVLLLLWFYIAVTGFPPSAMRAAILCSLMQLSFFAGDISILKSTNSLATAGVLLLIVSPSLLFDIGFQLSFLTVVALLVWGVPLCRLCHSRFRLLNRLIDTLLISGIASLAALPLVAYNFGIVPLIGIVFNPIAILLGSIIVGLGLIWLCCPWGWVSLTIGEVVLGVAQGLNRLVEWVAGLPNGFTQWYPSLSTLLTLYLLFFGAIALTWSKEPKKSVPLPLRIHQEDDPRRV